jgi:release factor glutamine methyltransferase
VILGNLDALLATSGAAFVEVGAGQASEVAALAEMQGFKARLHKDLAGIDRVVELRRDE